MNPKIYALCLLLFVTGLIYSQANKLAFVQNKGQWDIGISYKTDLPGGQALATSTGMLVGVFDTISLAARVEWGNKMEDRNTGTQYLADHPSPPDLKGHGWKFHFLNGNPAVLIENKGQSKDFYNFWVGEPNQQASKVRSYEEITYKNVYNDIDVKYYTSPEGYLENDIIIKPFANAGNLEFEIEGIDLITQNNNGDLILSTTVGDITIPSPISYLISDKGAHTPILINFILEQKLNGQTIRFSIPNYDKTQTLVIDPVVIRWATWATNNSSSDTHNHGTGIDSLGNLYITGRISSTGLITVGPFQSTSGGGLDIFVGKYTEPVATGGSGSRVWQTYLGGAESDNNIALQIGSDGYVYLAAQTSSNLSKTYGTGFTAGAWTQRTASAGSFTQALIVKLDMAGNGALTREMGSTSKDYSFQAADIRILKTGTSTYDLIYTGYIDHPRSVGVADGDFPAPETPAGTTYTYPNTSGTTNALLLRISSDFSSLVWIKNIGSDASTAKDDAMTITAIDASGNIYAAGYTTATANISYNNPSTQITRTGSQDGWIMKLNESGVVQWSRYFNGNAAKTTSILSMELTRSDTNLIIGGTTSGLAAANISASMAQSTYGGGSADLFVAKISKTGSMTNWGTYFGGSGTETNMMGLNTDQNDDIYFLGYSSSTNYLTFSNPLQSTNFGSNDAVFTKLNSSGTTTLYSTYYGGTNDDNDPLGQRGILFNNCRTYLSLTASSRNIPLTSGTITSTKTSAAGVPEPVIVSMANPPDLNNNNIQFPQTISCNQAPATLNAGVASYNIPAIIRNDVSQTNGTSGAYPSGVPTPSGYQWQKSIDYSFTWTDIAGATGQNYTPPALLETTCYRRIVGSDFCTSIDSNLAVVVSGGPNVFPSITCAGTTASFFANSTGGSGSNTYSWTGPLAFSSTLENPQILGASSAINGAYIISVTDVNGCKNTRVLIVNFNSCTYSLVLSVSLLRFDALRNGITSVLTWQTANEHYSDVFDIERSVDGNEWSAIGTVAASGNSTKIKGYGFVDKNPFDGLNYYRLKISDIGGNYKYSEIKSVYFDKLYSANIIDALPNPFTNVLTVNYSSSGNSNITIQIIDAVGHILMNTESFAVRGVNTIQVNTENFAKGIYFITVNNEGTSGNHKMLMKE